MLRNIPVWLWMQLIRLSFLNESTNHWIYRVLPWADVGALGHAFLQPDSVAVTNAVRVGTPWQHAARPRGHRMKGHCPEISSWPAPPCWKTGFFLRWLPGRFCQFRIGIYIYIHGMCKSSCDAWDGWVSDWLSANQHLGVFSRCGVVCPQLNDAGEVGRQGKCLTRGCSIHVLILDAFVDLCQRLLELLRRAKAEPDLLVRNAATWHHFVNPVQVCSSPHRHICSRLSRPR